MAIGIAAGLLLRHRKHVLKVVDKAMLLAVFVLLFLMGVSIGSDAQIMSNLHNVGLAAVIITVAAIAGSVLLAWIVFRVWTKLNK
ncbi:MAG: LysO family transporter [Salinivirgaceae bacterium]|jgi:uncharacterized membrane protein YbjE (DUF340 family)|nr:LysO family transporter [Salinivirgaceae bacterium]